jgi:hypothetical protein
MRKMPQIVSQVPSRPFSCSEDEPSDNGREERLYEMMVKTARYAN